MLPRISARFTLFSILLGISFTGIARDRTITNITDLAFLAQAHELVALAQVQDADYDHIRDFPVKGSAFLNLLNVYKKPEGLKNSTVIEVYAEGLADDRCYFPDRENEGRRFLVFLNRSENGKYEGLAPGCHLPVFVNKNNKYALLYPIADSVLSDESLVQEMIFADPDAWEDPAAYTFSELDFLKQWYRIRMQDTRFVYTRGIELSDVRKHLLKLK